MFCIFVFKIVFFSPICLRFSIIMYQSSGSMPLYDLMATVMNNHKRHMLLP